MSVIPIITDIVPFAYKLFGAILITLVDIWMPQNVTEVKSRVVLISGEARGIGKALANEFLKHGATVAICDINKVGCTIRVVGQV